MSVRHWLAAALWLATVVGALVLVLGTIRLAGPEFGDVTNLTLGFGLLGIDAVVYATVGALLVSRQPGNAVGWILLVTGPMMMITFSGFGLGSILFELHGANDLVAGLAGSIGGLALAPTILLAGPLLALYFPDGRLPGPRWRFPVAALLIALALAVAGLAFQPGPLSATMANNPFGIESPILRSLAPFASALFGAILPAGAALAVLAVTVRFRRSRGLERAQLKWLLAAIAVLVVSMAVAFSDGAADLSLLDATYILSLSLIPIAVGIAVLRYRLYDIDRIISRTLSYAVLTGVLAVVFGGIVLGLQAALAGITQGQTLAVAASTLAAFALFQPLRRRVQATVDRRFDRARYDAQRTVDEYAARLRNEVDLVKLRATLVQTVENAVHPLASAVWLRPKSRSQ